jgi:hypothetical protein
MTWYCSSAPAASVSSKLRICLAVTLALLCAAAGAQDVPFEVSNPKHKKWPVEQAARIYRSACDLVARTVRPEKPPQLRPKFVLVLGADADQISRRDGLMEVRLKSWHPEHFAQAVVIMATEDIVRREDIPDIAHSALHSSEASISVEDLRQER